MAQTAKCITSGNISDEAAAWLLAHECTIETSLGLSIILVSIEAEVLCYTHHNQYSIAFYDSEGELEETYAVVELDIDAYETRVYLKKPKPEPLRVSPHFQGMMDSLLPEKD